MRNTRQIVITTSAALTLILGVSTAAAWILSYRYAQDIRLFYSLHLSISRGNCRIVPGAWIYGASRWINIEPAMFSGEYHMGSNVVYIPLWLIVGMFVASSAALWRFRRRAASCRDERIFGMPRDPMVLDYATPRSGKPIDWELWIFFAVLVLGVAMVILMVN
jgi:hypothetical protein